MRGDRIIDTLKYHPIEEKREYKVSWDVYSKLADNTSHIRKQTISRMSASSIHFRQAETLYTNKSELTTIEGDGLRVNFFVSKCQFKCLECFNASSQIEGMGELFTEVHESELFNKLDYPFVDGLTFVGGEPFQNAVHLLPIAKKMKALHPEKTIWSYTGFLIEVLLLLDPKDPRRELLDYIDVLIDGQFIKEERDESDLKIYRGSSNQRLIKVQETIQKGETVLHEKN